MNKLYISDCSVSCSVSYYPDLLRDCSYKAVTYSLQYLSVWQILPLGLIKLNGKSNKSKINPC